MSTMDTAKKEKAEDNQIQKAIFLDTSYDKFLSQKSE